MERRDFLKYGLAAGATTAAVGSSSCASLKAGLLQANLPITVLEMEGFLSRLDTSMAAIDRRSPVLAFQGLLTGATVERENDPEFAAGVAALRKTMRSLLLVGAFADLPAEGRLYPGMQDRMWGSMAEMDEAMASITRLFTDLTPTERSDIGRALRDDPDLGVRIVEALDAESAEAGVPLGRRLHLRSIALEATARLKQSTPLLIDEYLGKVQKISGRHGSSEELERQFAARLGQDAFFAMREETLTNAARWRAAADDGSAVEGTLSPVPMPVYEPIPEQAPLEPIPGKRPRRREPTPEYLERREIVGTRLLTAGGVLLGLGVVIGGASLYLQMSQGGLTGWVVGITVGALAVVAGLVCLIIGLVKRLR